MIIDEWAAEFYEQLQSELAACRAENERLRAERDNHKARLAVEAVTAPDADYDAMMDSLQARLRDLHAEVERLTREDDSNREELCEMIRPKYAGKDRPSWGEIFVWLEQDICDASNREGLLKAENERLREAANAAISQNRCWYASEKLGECGRCGICKLKAILRRER